MNKNLITPAGLEKLKKEVNELKIIKRPELTERIKNAKELGDLSENADYQDAKETQGFMEGRILELENIIKTATVVDGKTGDKIGISSIVKLKSGDNIIEYTIVGASEVDLLNKRISNESPLGSALMDKKAGDKITIETPSGKAKYEILKVS
ncbi:transcription elongation factor GreA [Candidatus Parcubacteria bacterium]|nr:transcription elongation factor GreA [Candidatus Parcubacteria bacterium]